MPDHAQQIALLGFLCAFLFYENSRKHSGHVEQIASLKKDLSEAKSLTEKLVERLAAMSEAKTAMHHEFQQLRVEVKSEFVRFETKFDSFVETMRKSGR